MRTIIHKDVTIKTIDDWKAVAPPKDPVHQWKDGRSAKELARFALSEEFNNVLSEVLDSLGIRNQNFEAEPEAETYFRSNLVNMGTRGPRNHDLLLIGSDCVIGIEAKVSESFGETIKKEWENSQKGENKKHRILGLVEFV